MKMKLHKTNHLILHAITIGCVVSCCGWLTASAAAFERSFATNFDTGGTDNGIFDEFAQDFSDLSNKLMLKNRQLKAKKLEKKIEGNKLRQPSVGDII